MPPPKSGATQKKKKKKRISKGEYEREREDLTYQVECHQNLGQVGYHPLGEPLEHRPLVGPFKSTYTAG
jgi:hypothetical protein